jgi:hypothetical protein
MNAMPERFVMRWSLSTWLLTIGTVVIISIGLVVLVVTAMYASPGGIVVWMVLGLEGLVLNQEPGSDYADGWQEDTDLALPA